MFILMISYLYLESSTPDAQFLLGNKTSTPNSELFSLGHKTSTPNPEIFSRENMTSNDISEGFYSKSVFWGGGLVVLEDFGAAPLML